MSPAARSPAAQVAVLLAFVNTLDIEAGTDLLQTAAGLTFWLRENLALPPGAAAAGDELRVARDLRRGLRALLLQNNGERPVPADISAGGRAARRLTLHAGLIADQPGEGSRDLLVPTSRNPVLAALSHLVADYATARATGTWERLRQCPMEDCGWVFWDASPRGDRRWCTMRVCGNRAKARTFASRRRAARADP